MSNAKTSLFRQQIAGAAELFFGTMDGVSSELAHQAPGGTANNIASIVGHLATSIDGIINGMLQGAAPLMVMRPTGLSEMPPGGDDQFNWFDWGTRVQVDLPETLDYAKAVFESVDLYFASMTDEDFDKLITTPFGEMPTSVLLTQSVLYNTLTHIGDISTIKGIDGLKGFPV